MKSISFFLTICILLISCQNEPVASIEELTTQIKQLNTQMETAYNSGDLQGVANIYADDAYLIGPRSYQVQGRKAVDDYWTRIKNPIRWKLEVIEVTQKEEELYKSAYWKKLKNKPPHWPAGLTDTEDNNKYLYQLGHSKLEYEREDATHRVSHVDFVIVWRKQENGGYKIFVDTYNQNGAMGFD